MVEADLGSIFRQLGFIFILIILNGFFSACEMALVSVRRTRVKQLVDEGNLKAIKVQKLIDKPTNYMATLQIGVTLVGLMASAYAAVGLAIYPAKRLASFGIPENAAYSAAVFIITVCVGIVTIVLGEVFPKSLGIQHAEWLSLRVAGILNAISIATLPLVKLVTALSDLLVRPFGGSVKFSTPVVTEEELKMLVEAGEEEGVIEVEEKEMIHSIFDFTDTIAKQVMVPRTDMDCVPTGTTLPNLLQVISDSGHSRIPIYENNVDNIIGVIHAKDLLKYLVVEKVTDFDARKVMREPYYIPETKDVDELLAEFQRRNIQLAIVRDEYGGTAGMVTVEDLLEEIVGEIRDEYDESEEPMLEQPHENEYLVNARMRIDELNEELGTDFPEDDDFDTFGGFVFDLFGYQPKKGDTVAYKDMVLEVANLESDRIHKISVRRTAEKAENTDSNQ